jgi:hypothetical protein
LRLASGIQGYIGVQGEKEMISLAVFCIIRKRVKGAIGMSIDRFILKKLDNCHEERTRLNLVKLFKLRIQKAEKAENKDYSRDYKTS